MAKRRNDEADDADTTPRKSRRIGKAKGSASSPAQAETPTNRKSILKGTPSKIAGEGTPSSLRKVLFSTPGKDADENAEETPTVARNDRSARRKSARALQQRPDDDGSDQDEIEDRDLAQEILSEPGSGDSENEAIETQPSSAVPTPKRRGRPPGKKRERTPSPPPDLPSHELYFFQNRTGGNKTSANTLPSHLLLNHEDYYTHVKSIPDSHEGDIKRLNAFHERAFGQWVFELSQGFNLCLYGYGSKRSLVMDFAAFLYAQSEKPSKIVVINGYAPGLTLTDLYKSIYTAAAGPKANANPPANPEALVSLTMEHLNERPSTSPLCVIIHSLDHQNLRTKALTYPLLSRLTAHPSINLLATCDNPKFGLCWNSALTKAFRWLYHDATTFQPYTVEIDVVEEVNQLLGRGRRRLGGKDGVAYVLKSLPENARNLFRILVAEQLALGDIEPSTIAGAAVDAFNDDVLGDEDEEAAAQEQNTPSRRGRPPKTKKKPIKAVARAAIPTPEGVEYRTLYNKAVEEFVCSSELNFRTLLKEFHDHQMIDSRKDPLGTERLIVPFGKEELEAVLDELV